jgi:hypothetical protein
MSRREVSGKLKFGRKGRLPSLVKNSWRVHSGCISPAFFISCALITRLDMKSFSNGIRPSLAASRHLRRASLVWLAIALIVFAPCALQGLSLLQAAQYETNESRSECETNERIHVAAQPAARHAKSKGRPAENVPRNLQPAAADSMLTHAIGVSRTYTPPVVNWSPSMRC